MGAMSEIEVPMEKIQEDIHHHAVHGGSDKMISQGALLSAVLAVLAAISALFAGHYSNEAMILQIQSSDQWAFYQAKGVKSAIADLRAEVLKETESREKVQEYKKEQEEIKAEAISKENESRVLIHKHEGLASTVTFFQVAIAMTAIGVLSRRRKFIAFSSLLGFVGFIWMIKAFLI
jgi:hypothetical protein